MNTELYSILSHIDFTPEQINFFLDLNAALTEEDNLWMNEHLKDYLLETDPTLLPDEINRKTESDLAVWAESKGISRYTANMLFLIRALPSLHARYQDRGLSDEMFYCISHDLTNKLNECIKMHHVMGTFVFYWFHRHFKVELFGLGRFQYEERSFPLDDLAFYKTMDGSIQHAFVKDLDASVKPFYVLKQGSPVYNFHIPSSGPMPLEARLDSYRKAYEFFNTPAGEPIALVCDSWLLWPENNFIFPEGSNLHGFFDDFCILSSRTPGEGRIFPDDWRVYYTHYTGDTSLLPQNTGLQKNIASHLAKGGVIGSGFGVILFDGEKIISK